MTVRLVVRAAAEADITAAALWYEQRSSGLGTEFLRAVDVTLPEIARMPERYPLVRGDARRALLRRFQGVGQHCESHAILDPVASPALGTSAINARDILRQLEPSPLTPARRSFTVDIPRIFTITESAHRVHDPFTPEKLATLGAALRLESGARVLDLGSGSGEMLCTWARDHGVIGTGIDMSELFTRQARSRAEELGVADQVTFIHGDAAGYVSDEKADVAACVGATWIAGGVAGTIELLRRSLRTGGIILIGEPYWRQLPPSEDVAKGCLAHSISDFLTLPGLLASFGRLGHDVVEMVLADQDGWDRYEAAKWLTMRRWLEANPDDELAKDIRAQLISEPERYAAFTREYLGWGVFALMPR